MSKAVEAYRRLIVICQSTDERAELRFELASHLCRFGRHSEAIPDLEQAFDESANPELKAVLQLRLVSCYVTVGRAADAATLMEAGSSLPDALGNPVLQGHHYLARAELLGHKLDLEGAAWQYEMAARFFVEGGDLGMAAHAWHRTSTHHMQLGNLARGLEFSEQALELAELLRDLPALVEVHSIRAVMNQMLGDVSAMWAEVEKGQTYAENLSDLPVEAIYLRFATWFIRWLQGDAAALTDLEAEISTAAFPHPANEPGRWIALTKVLALQGRPDDSCCTLEQALKYIPREPPPGFIDGWLVGAINLLSAINDVGDAEEGRERYDALVRHSDVVVPHAVPALELGRCDSLNGRWEAGLDWLSKAEELCIRSGMKQYQALAEYERGLLHMRRSEAGDRPQARLWFKKALRLFEALEMRSHRRLTLEQLAALEGPHRQAGLTDAETNVFKFYYGHGMTYAEIAKRLFISKKTVGSHLSHARNKLSILNLRSRADWITWARNNLLDSEGGKSPDRPAA